MPVTKRVLRTKGGSATSRRPAPGRRRRHPWCRDRRRRYRERPPERRAAKEGRAATTGPVRQRRPVSPAQGPSMRRKGRARGAGSRSATTTSAGPFPPFTRPRMTGTPTCRSGHRAATGAAAAGVPRVRRIALTSPKREDPVSPRRRTHLPAARRAPGTGDRLPTPCKGRPGGVKPVAKGRMHRPHPDCHPPFANHHSPGGMPITPSPGGRIRGGRRRASCACRGGVRTSGCGPRRCRGRASPSRP